MALQLKWLANDLKDVDWPIEDDDTLGVRPFFKPWTSSRQAPYSRPHLHWVAERAASHHLTSLAGIESSRHRVGFLLVAGDRNAARFHVPVPSET